MRFVHGSDSPANERFTNLDVGFRVKGGELADVSAREYERCMKTRLLMNVHDVCSSPWSFKSLFTV